MEGFFVFSGENTVSTLGRMVLIIWLFVVLIINSSYTASLTSILTVQQLSSPIKGIDTLITSDQRVGFQVGSFAENYLHEELGIPESRLVALGSPEEYALALANGTVAAIVDERPYVDLFLSDHCHFSIRGQEFTKSGWGFVSISRGIMFIYTTMITQIMFKLQGTVILTNYACVIGLVLSSAGCDIFFLFYAN